MKILMLNYKFPPPRKANPVNLAKGKFYKLNNLVNISNLWIVNILPGDLCGRQMIFYFDSFGGIF